MRHYFILLWFTVFLSGCSGCSRSGRRLSAEQRPLKTPVVTPPANGASSADKTIVKMQEINGVYQIPVEIDGVNLFFIFDTGASTISISETEAVLLRKQGLLEDSDIKGNANYTDANGTLSEGTVINLKTVKIGDKVLNNVEASVVHTLNAPLLIGQSALAKFGKISIDYVNKTITFE